SGNRSGRRSRSGWLRRIRLRFRLNERNLEFLEHFRRGSRRFGLGRCGAWHLDWRSGRQFLLRHSCSFLESLTKFEEAVGVHRIIAFAMNLFELRGQVCRAPFVSCAEMHIEQALEGGRVPWGALQNIFEQIGGLLRKTVARE